MKRLLIGAFLAVVLMVLLIHDVPLASHLARVERDRLTTALERDAFILAGRAKEALETTTQSELATLGPYVAAYAAGHADAKVVVTDWRGRAVAGNDANTAVGEDYSNRPEISSALSGAPASGQRSSRTLGQDLIFVAVPVLLGDDVVGAVRISRPASTVDDEVRGRVIGIVSVGAISLFAVALAAVALASFIARPIRRLTGAAQRLAAGDLDVRADKTGPSEVRELAAMFNTMAARLSATLEHQRAFSGEVSHQLRTPLTALKLRLETAHTEIAAGRLGEERLVEAVEAAQAEAERMQSMVEQLLALARLEGGSATTVVLDAAEVVRERVALWRPLAEESGVEIVAEGRESAACRVIEGALEQMVDNLIDNAVTASPAGSSIVVEVEIAGDTVHVDVIDQGPGLSATERSAAFARFWRGQESDGGDGGSGLGLAIVRQLATAGGGSAELLAGAPDGTGIRARLTLARPNGR